MVDPRLQDLEFERLMQAAEAIEVEVANRMAEWLRDAWRAPKNIGGLSWEDRPIWWWRVQLIMWAGSRAARKQHRPDDLRAFRLLIKHMDDCELVELLARLLESRKQAQRSACPASEGKMGNSSFTIPGDKF
ncbi:MAG: hypothetical protein EA352_12630 [Gemmatimonadales bacterium]|nr:MAG: hypothetical protein EA352_12630 [Gemmatimonadales bacterium]